MRQSGSDMPAADPLSAPLAPHVINSLMKLTRQARKRTGAPALIPIKLVDALLVDAKEPCEHEASRIGNEQAH